MIDTATQFSPIAIPITASDRQQADQFAQQQPTQQQSEQVYRNTLAVLVTQRYLQLLGIDTDLEVSHSWNPLERLLENTADLYIPALQGFLECRSLRQSDRKCLVPPEVWSERIGYMIIQIDEPYQEGQMLGFVESVSVSELPRSYFQPLYVFLEQLTPERSPQAIVQLGKWRKSIFESDWQPPKDLFSRIKNIATQLSGAQMQLQRGDNPIRQRIEQLYRRHTRNLVEPIPVDLNSESALVKVIQTTPDDEIRWQAAELLWEINPQHPACPVISGKDLGIYLMGNSVLLMVGVLPKSDNRVLMLLRLYPLSQLYALPTGLKLIGLDETGNQFFAVESRPQDDYIQFKFTADIGDRFSVRVVLNDASFIDSFVV
ncbi:DUF1822 family protein [Anabaena sp. CCY 0017]|uniref:DUF1822 family protein n=1 Tax=Anabaena sp. CCY 0017 TaxID=3103866 RepID=UPI0039C6F6C8